MPRIQGIVTRCRGACGDAECEILARQQVLTESLSWMSTPFHMNAALKGVGVDCGRFPYLVYRACGIDVPDLPSHWPRDFACHKMADSEPYLTLIQSKLDEVATPLPGDLAVFKPTHSRCYSHAAICIDWPNVIHARGVGSFPKVEAGIAGQWPLDGPVRYFSPFHVSL